MGIADGIIIAIAVLLSAFFSGMEIAFLSANKLKIELDNKQGVLSATILSGFIRKQSKFIGTLLVGNNIALVVFGIYTAVWLEPWLSGFLSSEVWILLLQTVISTLIILFFGEFLPKTVFRLNSNFLLNIFSVPLLIVYYLLWIPMTVMVGISEWVLKYLLRVETQPGKAAFGRVDLDNYVREITSSAEHTEEELEHEIQIFQNALDFSKVKARDCMVPRTEVAAVEVSEEVEKLKQVFIDTGYSKILVYRDSIDNIIGYVNSIEMFRKVESIRRLVVPVIIIPETISANEVLRLFIQQNKSLAVVVDEFGGTSGILTIEDVMEEIFGDIEDEHDHEEFLEEKISDSIYHFSARLEIDYLNDKYKFDLPESEEYETLAGLILNKREHIPDINDVMDVDGYRLTITAGSNVRIESVRVEVLEDE